MTVDAMYLGKQDVGASGQIIPNRFHQSGTHTPGTNLNSHTAWM